MVVKSRVGSDFVTVVSAPCPEGQARLGSLLRCPCRLGSDWGSAAVTLDEGISECPTM